MNRKSLTYDEKKLIVAASKTPGFMLFLDWIKEEKYVNYIVHKQAIKDNDVARGQRNLIVAAAKMDFIDEIDIKLQRLDIEVNKKQ